MSDVERIQKDIDRLYHASSERAKESHDLRAELGNRITLLESFREEDRIRADEVRALLATITSQVAEIQKDIVGIRYFGRGALFIVGICGVLIGWGIAFLKSGV